MAGGGRKQWPAGTVLGWCPNCGAQGKFKAKHNKPGYDSRKKRVSCGRYSFTQQQAEYAFLGLGDYCLE